MPKLLEKHIVDYIFDHLADLTGHEMIPFRKEYVATKMYPSYRCDLLCYKLLHNGFKFPFLCEVKFNGNDRDLRLELSKALLVRDTRSFKYGLGLVLFIDDVSDLILIEEMLEQHIDVYHYTIDSEYPLQLSIQQVIGTQGGLVQTTTIKQA